MAASLKAKNRKLRQDNLREWLSEKCTAQHLVDNLIKIEELDETEETFQNSLNKLKVANEQRLKILNKYLPDLKSTELSMDNGEGGGVKSIKIEFVDCETPDSK